MDMITGVFELPDQRLQCSIESGSTLAAAASAAGVMLDGTCGGAGFCGGCVVELHAGTFVKLEGEPIDLPKPGRRVLSCQTKVMSDFQVRVPKHSLVSADEKVIVDFEHLPDWVLSPPVSKVHMRLRQPALTDQAGDIERISTHLAEAGFDRRLTASLEALRQAPVACRQGGYEITATLSACEHGYRIIRVEPGDTTGRLFGVAVDVGTTTVVCSLIDLTAGLIIDSASSYNKQVRKASDVASRISAAGGEGGLEEMRTLVIDQTINRQLGLLTTRHEIAPDDIAHISIAANTVMTHLLLGVDPTHLGAVPFQAACNSPTRLTAGAVGLAMNPAGTVDIAPSTAAYLGGDISADLIVCGLCEKPDVSLMVDIGTNAEIVVGNRDRVVACAAPAGPAFEGQGTSCGMRAASGAIDSIEIDPADFSCKYTVLDNNAPVGLCGSAMIDFLAEAYHAGLINMAGRFDRDAAEKKCPGRLVEIQTPSGSRSLAYVIVAAEDTDDNLAPVAISEADIAILLQAKGVIYAGIEIALKHLGKSFSDIAHVDLAGGFARKLRLANAVGMGLLPDIPLDRYRFIGNGSLAGAYLNLIDQSFAKQLASVTARPEVIELNLDPDFQDAYTMAMLLPMD